MTCPKCAGGVLRPRKKCRFDSELKGERVKVIMGGLRCDQCGWQTVLGTRMGEFGQRVADAYRRKHRLLTSDEIRTRRVALGMSQARFAKWLGVAASTVKRWELGLVQDPAMDGLIRLKSDPRALRELQDALKKLVDSAKRERHHHRRAA